MLRVVIVGGLLPLKDVLLGVAFAETGIAGDVRSAGSCSCWGINVDGEVIFSGGIAES